MDFIKVIFGIAALIWLFRSEHRTNWKKPENYKKILEENARKQPDTAFMSSEERKTTEPEHISTQQESRKEENKPQPVVIEQPMAQETPTEKKIEPVQDTPVSETPAAKEKTVQSQGAADLFDAMYYMHQHECWGHEITKYHKLVQRLNQIHHNLTYGDIPEVDCPTVIRLLKKNDGHALNWETVYFTDYHYDDNGILRKIETANPDYPKIPANEALTDVQVFDENGNILRHCPAFVDFSKSSFRQIPPVLAIHSGAIRNGQYGYERYELTIENLYSDTFEPKPIAKDGRELCWRTYVPFAGEKRTLDYWYGRTFFPEAPGYEEWSFKILKCSPKFKDRLSEQIPSGECGDEMTWKQNGDTLYIEGEGELDSYVFQNDSSIRKVVIAPGCTEIGEGTFFGCENLQTVELAEGLLRIGEDAFLDCRNLREINLPEGLQEIGANAFSLCENLKLQIPDSVTEIGESAFQSVQEICYLGPEWSDNNWGADQWVDKVLRGACEPGTWKIRDNTLYVHIKGELPLEKFEEPSWHPHVSETVVRSPWYPYEGRFEHAVIFPGCTKIKTESFRFSAIKTISIPSTVTEIESHAFDQCHNLQSVVLPEGITEVVDDMFHLCKNLTSVEIPDSVTRIGNYAFCGCRNLRSVKLPQNLTVIGHGAFSGCTQLTALKIPEGVMEIGGDAFKNCSQLASVTIPAGVTRIGHSTFEGLSCAANIQVDEKNSNIVNIDGLLIDQARGILLTCLREKTGRYVIPDGITEIGDCAFIDQKNLTDIVIPEGVMEIGFRAFGGCEGLTSVEIPGSVTKIEDFTFSECTGLVSAVLREGVREIGMDAFCGCTGLTRVEIPESLTKIGGCAFERCDNLVSVRIPSGVTELQSTALGGLSGLKEIQVDENNACFASLDGVLFDKKLQKLICFPGGKTDRYVIPGSVTRIGSYAFGGCHRLKSVTIPDSVTTVEMRAFLNCSGLETLIVPDSVMDIWNQAFFGIPHIIYNGPAQSEDNWGALSRN